MVTRTQDLNGRARHLLRTLVANYIQEGQPVGSRSLARHSGLSLSAATIRNVMADLEDAGLVSSPHTSAGRIPTVQGYRFFVDTLLKVVPVEAGTYQQIETRLTRPRPASKVASSASDLLSMLTSFVGVVTLPKREQFAFRHIDFVHISETQLLVILVFQDNEVQNRIIHCKRSYSVAELERAANFLNTEFSGLLLGEIRRRLIADLVTARQQMDQIMNAAIDIAKNAFANDAATEVVVSGQTNLMNCDDLSDVEQLKRIFDKIQHQQDMLQLLDECVSADGVRLFIGEESGSEALDSCSLVTAPYSVDGQTVGVLGVIGPTRMAYDRVISVVEATAEILGSALNQKR